MKKILTFFIGFILIQIISATTFNVNNLTDLQNALNTASTNGENDIINVSSGTYNVASTVTFWSDEDYTISINGENNTIFNGGDLVQNISLITVSDAGNINISGIIFEHGKADYGGALYLETQNADVNVSNCIARDNVSNYVCAGIDIYSQTGSIEVDNCEFYRNSSPNTMGYPYGTAGGLFIQTEGANAEITLLNSRFENNSAHRDAAGAMLYPVGNNSSVTVQNNTFNSNIADEFGGGCWIRCPAGSSNVNYNNNTLANNSTATAGSGGGTYIEIESGTIDFFQNTHIGNNSAWQGGGLWISNIGGTINMHDNFFRNNHSDEAGGGANIYLESGTANFHHNVFDDNESLQAGGGLCFSTTSGAANIFNNTFYSNSADDGGDVYLYFDAATSTSSFYNNILYGSSMPALSYSGAISISAIYSDIDSGSGESWFGTGCIDDNPLFADAISDDFHLTWTNFPTPDVTKSPCIDTGNPASPNDPDGTRADIGAFYFNQAELASPANLTITHLDGNITISWDAVSGATSYNVYSDTNPYGTFSALEYTTSDTTWSETITTETKKFYYVKAIN